MRILKWLLAGLVLLVAGVLGYGFTLPQEVTLSRKIDINRPAATVYTTLNDLRTFNAWSPWADRDPKAKYEFSGEAYGKGQISKWSGNKEVGTGAQEIVESIPFEKVATKLTFAPKEFAGAEWLINPGTDGKASSVEWRFKTDIGATPWMRILGKYVIRGAIAKDYEAGLKNLKAFVEKLPEEDFSALRFEDVTLPAQPIAFVDAETTQDPAAFVPAMAAAFAKVRTALKAAKVSPAGPPLSVSLVWADGKYTFRAAIPVAADTRLPASSGVSLGTGPGGPAIKTVFQGPNSEIQPIYLKSEAYFKARGLKEGATGPVEVYITDPTDRSIQPPVTELYFPWQP